MLTITALARFVIAGVLLPNDLEGCHQLRRSCAPVTTYVAFDGATVMYGAPWEHAVTLIGMSPGSVLINNPHGGQEWISKGTFEHAYEMFNQMAVTLS